MATITQQWTTTSPSTPTTYSKAYSASQLVEIDESIPDSSTDLQINVAIDISEIEAFEIMSDQDILVEGNNSSGVAGSVSLIANVPYRFNSDWYDTFKFTADLTALFITNASGSAAAFKLRCVYDATP